MFAVISSLFLFYPLKLEGNMKCFDLHWNILGSWKSVTFSHFACWKSKYFAWPDLIKSFLSKIHQAYLPFILLVILRHFQNNRWLLFHFGERREKKKEWNFLLFPILFYIKTMNRETNLSRLKTRNCRLVGIKNTEFSQK